MSEVFYIGTRIELRLDALPFDITGADSVSIMYKKPNRQTGEWMAEKEGSEIVYRTMTTDIDLVGTWQLQACAKFAEDAKCGKICFVDFISPLN